MNLEAINKWLDNEYGCSYTRLEELHDFYFEKYCDLKKENNQLKGNWNELKKWLEENESFDDYCNETTFTSVLDKMEELEGSDSNDNTTKDE